MSDTQRAQTLLDVRRYVEAVELLTQHLGSEPEDWQAHCLLSQGLLAMDRASDAFTAAGRAAALAPAQEWPYRLQALALVSLRRAREAVPIAERSVACAPHQWQSLHTLAGAYLAANMKGKARDVGERLLAAAPNEAKAVLRAAEVSEALKDKARARALTDRALALDPTSAVIQNDRAAAMLRRSRPNEALQGFSAAASLDPSLSVAAKNFNIVVRKTLNRTTWVALAFAYIGGRVVPDAVDSSDEGGSTLARLMCLLVALALPLVMLGVYRRVVLPLPTAVQQQVLREIRRDRATTVGLWAYVAAIVGFAISAALPNGVALDGVVLACLSLLVSRFSYIWW